MTPSEEDRNNVSGHDNNEEKILSSKKLGCQGGKTSGDGMWPELRLDESLLTILLIVCSTVKTMWFK